MDIIEIQAYKKKMKTCEQLGAVDFQKVVFEVERIKFKLIKKICPNFIKYYDKYCDNLRNKLVDGVHDTKKIKEINSYINFIKLEMRKELNTEKNRNYHINKNDSEDIYKYLLWNKNVHKKGLIKDLVAIPVTTVGTVVLTPWLTPLLVYEMFSAFINFECINIQNYNICRYKLVEDKLKEREERKLQKNIEEYGEIAKVVTEKIETSEKLPSLKDIIDSLEEKEQVEKLRRIIIRELEERELTNNKTLVRGNK